MTFHLSYLELIKCHVSFIKINLIVNVNYFNLDLMGKMWFIRFWIKILNIYLIEKNGQLMRKEK